LAKELPYFRFTVQDWQNGKISLESFELQGLFISACGYYWINDCCITLTMLKKRFSNSSNLIDELVNLEIIKHEKRHDKIQIDFLNIQYDLLSEKRKRRQDAGLKGSNAKAMLKQKDSYKDKDKDKDNDKDKDKDKDNLKETFFSDFPNSSYLESVCRDLGKSKDEILVRLMDFRAVSESKYNSMSEFSTHLKRWINKNPAKKMGGMVW
jgi:hypothetical protein